MKKITIAFLFIASFFLFGFLKNTSVINNNAKTQTNLVWHTNVATAVQIAKKEDKPLFFFFTGSDWCGWCIRLQKEVFKTDEFAKWATNNVVLVELDFPARTPQAEEIKKQNQQLQQMFSVRGYPTVWIVKANENAGKVNLEPIGSIGYLAGGPTTWLAEANKIIEKYTPNVTPKSPKKAKKK